MNFKKCCNIIVGPIGFKYIGSDQDFHYFNCPQCQSTKVLTERDLMEYLRSFRLDKLYHQFLKPQGLSIELIEPLAKALESSNFIELQDNDRYCALDKLTQGKNRPELFKIIQKLKNQGATQ